MQNFLFFYYIIKIIKLKIGGDPYENESRKIKGKLQDFGRV